PSDLLKLITPGISRRIPSSALVGRCPSSVIRQYTVRMAFTGPDGVAIEIRISTRPPQKLAGSVAPVGARPQPYGWKLRSSVAVRVVEKRPPATVCVDAPPRLPGF